MKKDDAISYQFRTTTNLIHRYLDIIISETGVENLTGINGWVIKYLVANENKEIFQKDIEEDLAMQRSTASRLLKRMEKNGYIKREGVSYDKRLKKVIATKKLYEANNLIHEKLNNTEIIMREGINETEIQSLFNTINKIKSNLNINLNKLENKKEDAI